LRARIGGLGRVGVGFRLIRGGFSGGHFHGHQIEGGEHRLVIGFLRVGGGLFLRGGRRIVRRVNLHEQVVRADHLVVENVNGGNLAGNPRCNGNDVSFNESVVGGFVGEGGDQIIQSEKQQ